MNKNITSLNNLTLHENTKIENDSAKTHLLYDADGIYVKPEEDRSIMDKISENSEKKKL